LADLIIAYRKAKSDNQSAIVKSDIVTDIKDLLLQIVFTLYAIGGNFVHKF